MPSQKSSRSSAAAGSGWSDVLLFSVVVAGFVVLAVVVAVMSGNRKAEFRSAARFKLEQRFDPRKPALDAASINQELAEITSTRVLGQVVETLGLQRTWAKETNVLSLEEATAELKRRLAVRLVRNTSLFEIEVAAEDPAEAAEIANTVVETFRTDLVARNVARLGQPFPALETQKVARAMAVHHATVELRKLQLTNAAVELIASQSLHLADAERALEDITRELEKAAANVTMAGTNNLRVAVIDQATAPVRTMLPRNPRIFWSCMFIGLAVGVIAAVMVVAGRRSARQAQS